MSGSDLYYLLVKDAVINDLTYNEKLSAIERLYNWEAATSSPGPTYICGAAGEDTAKLFKAGNNWINIGKSGDTLVFNIRKRNWSVLGGRGLAPLMLEALSEATDIREAGRALDILMAAIRSNEVMITVQEMIDASHSVILNLKRGVDNKDYGAALWKDSNCMSKFRAAVIAIRERATALSPALPPASSPVLPQALCDDVLREEKEGLASGRKRKRSRRKRSRRKRKRGRGNKNLR